MRYLVRLDDITPYMNRRRFEAVRDILDRYKIRPIIGVVPDCRDENIYAPKGERYSDIEFKELLAELTAGGWTIAQHGTNHVYSTKDGGLLGINPFSEFAGLSYDTQYTKLKQGQARLRGLEIDTTLFMAPGHSFDMNTLKALKTLGFSAVTDGLYHKPYIREGILFIPCTLTAYDKMKDTDTICLHPNLMDDTDLRELERFLEKHAYEATDYDEDALRAEAVKYSPSIAHAESSALRRRESRNRIASSKKLSNFMVYTNHKNKVIKWIKRVIYSPLLLTSKFQ